MKIETNSNILVVTGSTSIPVMIADRMLKYGYQMMQVQNISDVLKLPEVSDYFGLAIISMDGGIANSEMNEIIAGVARIYPNLKFMIAVHPGETSEELQTQGIEVVDVVAFPFESELLVSRVFEMIPSEIPVQRLSLDAVTQIHLPPIEDLDVLPFDVFIFLPLNNRAILYKKAGQRGFQRDLNRISVSKNAPIYIRRTDFSKYSHYLSQYVSSVDEESQMPGAVRVQVMQKRFTSIMRSFFSQTHQMQAEESQAMLDSVRKIAADFAQASSDNPVLHDRIRMLIGRSINNYAHAMNVSAYCTIFGIMAGLEDVDSLSLGGLFHDIGMSELPPEIAASEFEDLQSDEDRETYLSHGPIGVELLEKRGIPTSYEVQVMIERHHDLIVPSTDRQVEVHPYAAICAFADVFDELTSVKTGRRVFTPFEAVQFIAGMGEGGPHPVYIPEIHEPIVQQFLLDALENGEEDLAGVGA